MDILKREFVYVWYYFSVQLEQIFRYWVLGMVLGSAISVFGKNKIHSAFSALGDKKAGGAGADSRKPAGDRLAAVHVWDHSHCGVFFAERDERRFRIGAYDHGAGNKDHEPWGIKDCVGSQAFCVISCICDAACPGGRTAG